MKKAKKNKGKLPSGNYRKNRLDYIDETGKKHWKSFTAPTMAEVDLMIAEWKLNKTKDNKKGDITVSEAVRRYISAKSGVLSPSTLKSYYSLLRTNIEGSRLGATYLGDLQTKDIQIWVSDLSATHSPKSVKNINALVKAAVEMFEPDFRYRVTLPQRMPTNLYCPSDQDVKRLLDEIREKDVEMYRAVLLAAFGPLRRSEICALTSDDFHGNTVVVNKALVYDEVGQLIVKTTKTASSTRTVDLPDFVIEATTGVKGRLVTSAPDVLSNRFKRTVNRIGGPHFRFHDLRHYSASIMHAIGVPDVYIQKRAGWASSSTLRRVYMNVIDLEQVKQTQKINKHFQDIV